jgi:hypothetical protein
MLHAWACRYFQARADEVEASVDTYGVAHVFITRKACLPAFEVSVTFEGDRKKP